MNENIKKTILDKIIEYDKIIIGRHFRPDGDAIGSTKGLREILRDSFPQKQIFVMNDDYSDYIAFLGEEDKTAEDEEFYRDALGIIIDTGTEDRISNKRILNCKEVIKIDHHIDIKPYGTISWVEDFRSAACEMIVDFYNTFKDTLVLTKQSATYLYTGMCTDTGRFKYGPTRGETLRLASILLDKDIDVDWIYANLYLSDFDYLKFESYVLGHINRTENGVAYIVVDKKMQEEFNLTREQASNVISFLDSIKGCISWIAFIENGDDKGSIRVRLRSRFMPINTVGEKYRGGGHECACGATVYSYEEIDSLLKDADALVKEYKATHEVWL